MRPWGFLVTKDGRTELRKESTRVLIDTHEFRITREKWKDRNRAFIETQHKASELVLMVKDQFVSGLVPLDHDDLLTILTRKTKFMLRIFVEDPFPHSKSADMAVIPPTESWVLAVREKPQREPLFPFPVTHEDRGWGALVSPEKRILIKEPAKQINVDDGAVVLSHSWARPGNIKVRNLTCPNLLLDEAKLVSVESTDSISITSDKTRLRLDPAHSSPWGAVVTETDSYTLTAAFNEIMIDGRKMTFVCDFWGARFFCDSESTVNGECDSRLCCQKNVVRIAGKPILVLLFCVFLPFSSGHEIPKEDRLSVYVCGILKRRSSFEYLLSNSPTFESSGVVFDLDTDKMRLTVSGRPTVLVDGKEGNLFTLKNGIHKIEVIDSVVLEAMELTIRPKPLEFAKLAFGQAVLLTFQ
jgi:hypothetical protein